MDTTSHNDGEWYQTQHEHHLSHHDGYCYYSDSDTDIQPSSHRSHHLDRDRDYEIDCENNKRNITNGCTSRQKHKRDYSSGNESNSNDIPPMGPSEKDGNILTTKVMTKVMPTKGMRSILTRKVLRNVTALNIPMRGFLAFIQVTTKVMKKVMPTK